MSKTKTKQEFIEQASIVHNGKYDYSKVEYVNDYVKVCIICPTHGEFWQRPYEHLRGQKCRKCTFENQKKLVFGKGLNDMYNASKHKSYSFWIQMLRRCYNEQKLLKEPTYRGCSVCDEWLTFSNFYNWFNNHYVKDWHLDKDILVKGNKEYSPDKCCFVPQGVNNLLTKRQNHRGNFPIGVHQTSDNGYRIIVSKEGRFSRIGKFRAIEDAFNAYKKAKEEQIKRIADKYKKQLEPRVYKALYEYQVEITD